MKPTFLDRLIGWFSPKAALNRTQARQAQTLLLRGYDAAKSYGTSDWTSANNADANSEIGKALTILRQKSRDLTRNSPYALRALNVIVSNTVGAGIVAQIKGRNKTQQKRLTELWKQVTESTECDFEGRHNFASLQALAMRTIVESGECLALKKLTPDAPQIKLLESDFICSAKDAGQIYQGIEIDADGKRLNYYLYTMHPGSRLATNEPVVIPASEVIHAFRQDRPGQLRGVPWAHAVIESLKDFQDYQAATIIRQKIAACFGGFITTMGDGSLLSGSELLSRREDELSLEPATFRYLKNGEDVKFANPPGVDGYAEFVRESMRAIASGYGISYEALTGDYSQVNYSSARMGKIEMQRNIDAWRWAMLIPQFCEPYFQWFLEWAKAKGADIEGAGVEWVPPSYVMVDPTKEIDALKKEVRAGFKTYGQALREQGLDPDNTLLEIADWNKKIDDLQVVLDSDPRKVTQVGILQADNSNSSANNGDNTSGQSQETIPPDPAN